MDNTHLSRVGQPPDIIQREGASGVLHLAGAGERADSGFLGIGIGRRTMIDAAELIQCVYALVAETRISSCSSVRQSVDSSTGDSLIDLEPLSRNAAALKLRATKIEGHTVCRSGCGFRNP